MDYLSFLALALGRACTASKPDVVVSLSDPPLVGLIGALAAARHRCPYVQICHDVHPDITIALGKVQEGLPTRLWRGINRYVQRRAIRIVVVGRDMEEKLAGEGVPRARLRFIPTWASAQEHTPRECCRQRAEHGWLGKFVVMHAGNMGLSQNIGMYVDVARALLDLEDVGDRFCGGRPGQRGPAQAGEGREAARIFSSCLVCPSPKRSG